MEPGRTAGSTCSGRTASASASFSATCTGTAQVHHVRAVNGNRFLLGDWTASAHVVIARSGREERASSSRDDPSGDPAPPCELQARAAHRNDGKRYQDRRRRRLPRRCDGRSVVRDSDAGWGFGRGVLHPDLRPPDAHCCPLDLGCARDLQHRQRRRLRVRQRDVEWRIVLGVRHPGDTIWRRPPVTRHPPSTPAGLGANLLGSGDGETDLTWSASSDNATPTGLLVYEVFLNSRFDQAIGGEAHQGDLFRRRRPQHDRGDRG